MSEIFVSHAVADKELAKLLVSFLKEAIGVPEAAIFCSSMKGHHIPVGEDFNSHIKKKIKKPKLVVLLMTLAYMESSFCLMELGAAWCPTRRILARIQIRLVEISQVLAPSWRSNLALCHEILAPIAAFRIDSGTEVDLSAEGHRSRKT